ncbi:Clp protease N-terminal domain-containing protein [Mycobacterium sp. NAZ190054]|uniref:Clp protease N-terminal domain-containing protein n=1 Tax=Mycobacterium sp. NAZ190054 TaxID=1747766 RepID=UPI000793CA7F|nr:Clp protease N-terminal domain-containing protein [Mycobacterium sp. NAZ190054]KWX65748.1 Clp protease [Mycobacterium sp. NAZ190054]
MFERFSRNARVAVILAQEGARELEAREIRPEHLLVGVLQSAGRDLAAALSSCGVTAETVRQRLSPDAPGDDAFDDDAEALRAIGIDLRVVRENVDRAFGADSFDNALRPPNKWVRRRGHLPFTKASKKALELALREAVAHRHNWIGCEHMVLGILRAGDDTAVALLTEHVEAGELRRSIDAVLDAAA